MTFAECHNSRKCQENLKYPFFMRNSPRYQWLVACRWYPVQPHSASDTMFTLVRNSLEPRRITGHIWFVDCPLLYRNSDACVALLVTKKEKELTPLSRPAFARVTSGHTCHPQTCAYGGRWSFSDLRRLSCLRYRSRTWRIGRVLNRLLLKHKFFAERDGSVPRALASLYGRNHVTGAPCPRSGHQSGSIQALAPCEADTGDIRSIIFQWHLLTNGTKITVQKSLCIGHLELLEYNHCNGRIPCLAENFNRLMMMLNIIIK